MYIWYKVEYDQNRDSAWNSDIKKELRIYEEMKRLYSSLRLWLHPMRMVSL